MDLYRRPGTTLRLDSGHTFIYRAIHAKCITLSHLAHHSIAFVCECHTLEPIPEAFEYYLTQNDEYDLTQKEIMGQCRIDP